MSINDYRQVHGLTIRELATLLGISKDKAWKICKGEFECLRYGEIAKISEATSGKVLIGSLVVALEG